MMLRFLLIFSLIYLSSCSEDEYGAIYNYQTEFESYYNQLSEENLDDIKQSYLFVIPLRSCSICVDKSLENLTTYQYPAKVLLVGQCQSEEMQSRVDHIKKHYDYTEDPSSLLFKYETDMGKPSLLTLVKKIRKLDLEVTSWKLVDGLLKT